MLQSPMENLSCESCLIIALISSSSLSTVGVISSSFDSENFSTLVELTKEVQQNSKLVVVGLRKLSPTYVLERRSTHSHAGAVGTRKDQSLMAT